MNSVLTGRLSEYAVLLGTISILAGCANLNTISRQSTIGPSDNMVTAIHLDIQQRLLIANAMGKYCAEPSPDALAAFAAATGIGASAPTEGAVSAAGGVSSSAASIGLRTQSITLMRDSLYRMCEAYANGQLTAPQVMALLSRSQDLTAVVLATEQLTGAVIAHQAALSSNTSSDATAVMTATAELLEAAMKQQERAQARLEQAMERKVDADAKKTQAEGDKSSAQAYLDEHPTEFSATARLNKAEANLQSATRLATLAEDIHALRQKTLDAADERVEALQSARDSAATTAAASTSTDATLAGGGERSRLNDQSTQAIASAVSDMVNNVVNKSYVLDFCMAMVSAESIGTERNDQKVGKIDPEVRKMCLNVVGRSMDSEVLRITAFGPTTETSCIKSWLSADVSNLAKLDEWRKENANGVDHVDLVFGKSTASLRSDAVRDLSIPCR